MRTKKAFTLIELLVVIAIISLLMSIVVPSLRLAKRKASSVVCLTNTKNMSLAWYSYQSDNRGRIMSAQMDAREPDNTYVGWIGRPRTETGTPQLSNSQTTPVTDADAIRGIEAGRLNEYLKSPKVFKCPGDTLRKSQYTGTNPYVSYSMARCLYSEPNPSAQQSGGSNGYQRQIRNFGEIRNPSGRYVFVEVAQERNWNEAGWFSFGAPEWTGSNQWGWWDPVAINHGDSSIIGFADGHAETRKWVDRNTRERVEKLSRLGVTLYNIELPPADQRADIDYMAAGWAYRHRF